MYFPEQLRVDKIPLTEQEDNCFFNPLMTEANCFVAMGRDLPRMCKTDLSPLILYRATTLHFSDHNFYSPWHAPWWYEGFLLYKKYLIIELSFSVGKKTPPNL